MFILHLKKLMRNPVICIAMLLTIGGYLWYLFFGFEDYFGTYLGSALSKMIVITPIMFFVFLFLSYEVFFTFRKDNFNEALSAGKISFRYQKYDFLFLFLLNAICLIAMICFQIGYYQRTGYSTKALSIYTVRICMMYYGLTLLFAIFAGWVLSGIKKRLVGLSLLLLTFYIFDDSFFSLLLGIAGTNKTLWKISTLFSIFTWQREMVSDDIYYLMSAENVHLYCILFWIGMTMVVAALMQRKKISIVFGGFSILMLIGFFLDNGAVYAPSVSSYFDKYYESQKYYEYEDTTRPGKTWEKADFKITGYDLTMRINDNLTCNASMQLDHKNLDNYDFTLYHAYHVKSVTDDSGNNLDYIRNGDYITIKNSGNINGITICYEGASQIFYSTSQAVMLPANFEYYPVAGHQKVYLLNVNNNCFTYELPKDDIPYKVTLYTKGSYPVYTNFPESGTAKKKGLYWCRTFSGKSNGLTILASYFATEKEVGGVRVIYSLIDNKDSHNAPIDTEHEKEFQKTFQKMGSKGISVQGKTFFAFPEFMGIDENHCFADDHFGGQIWSIKKQAVNFYKKGVVYQESDEEGRKMLEESKRMLEEGGE